MRDPVVLAEVVRSGFVECRHRGSLVALEADGSVAFAQGDVTSPIYPRSSNKPLQATGMVRHGLDLADELLALTSASHSGEPFHLDGVRRILAGAGLDESALQCPKSWPIDDEAKANLIRAGERPARVTMNCSGKHAGMLATCVANGWPIETYLEPEHPLQVGIRETIEDLTGEKVAHVGIDGCGAPLLAFSLTGLARSFRALVLEPEGSAGHRVASAIRAHPEYVSGTDRDEVELLRSVPGLVGKSGAEACYAVALPDARVIALKIEDGGQRARPVVMAAALRRFGIDNEVIADQASGPVKGGGESVGEIRSVGV